MADESEEPRAEEGAAKPDEPTAVARAEESPGKPAEPASTAAPAGAQASTGTPAKKSVRRRVLAALVAAAAAAVPLCVMCTTDRHRASVPVGFVCCLVASFAILDALAVFDAEGDDARVRARTTLRELLPRILELVLGTTSLVTVLTLAVAGVLPKPILTAAVLVPGTFLWTVTAVFRLGRSLGAFADEDGQARPLLRRHGFWLVVTNVVLFLPLLGSYSLSDPWETHYGEVAREMLSRDDWISTWWAQDGWFWSKPVLDFWMQALSFSLLGVKYLPDQMLSAASTGRFPQPEWAARMPVFLLTLAGAFAFYRAIARVFGRRAGFIAGVALTTMPYWYLVAHQTMTDMPYVAPLTTAMSFVLLGFLTDEKRELPLYEVSVGSRTFRFSALHLVLGVVLVCALPQILYLVSRNLTLYTRSDLFGFRFHPDEFFSGSGEGNCGLPGNQQCQKETPVHKELWPIAAAGIWTATTGAFAWMKRRERRLKSVFFLAGWFFLALSMLGKGAPGLVLPIVAALGFAVVTGRFKQLERVELWSLVLVVACVGLPWYVQMYMRHGHPFIDRLIMHDMYKRAFVHVHDTNQGDDVTFRYYVWQLGYGLFPWTGISAGALLWAFRRPDRTRDSAGDVLSFMLVWFLAAFGMFTITLTKFHHYILPLVPPTAAVTGIVADRLLGDGSPARPGKLAAYVAGLLGSVVLFVYGVVRLFPRKALGEALAGPAPWRGWGVLCIVLGVLLAAVVFRRFGAGRAAPIDADGPSRASPSGDFPGSYDDAMFALLGLASAVALALAGRDLFTKIGSIEGQARLMQLFTYNYTRVWPDSLDFTGALVAFTVLTVIASFGLCFRSLRRHAAALLVASAAAWTAWGLDVYLFKASPHWGQRETVLAYYADRKTSKAPFVAYQMNWKGENFYTGNRCPAWVSSGEKFKTWINEQKERGVREMYFTSEHGRLGSLKRELGDPPSFTEITDKKLNNKFFVARVRF